MRTIEEKLKLKNFLDQIDFYFQEGEKEGSCFILHSDNNEDNNEPSEAVDDIHSSLILEAPKVFAKFICLFNDFFCKLKLI